MIHIKSLTKRFGSLLAVDRVTLDVAPGEVLGFLGPNGAGKSTTMKMVTGFLTPTSGSATVCGRDVASDTLAAQERIGYLPEGAPAYPDMTPLSFLTFIAQIRGFRGAERKRRIDEVVRRVSLTGVMRQPIETLSKGYKRRVGLAQAILHDPQVLIMDEPTDGLDPNQKHEVREQIRHMASQSTAADGRRGGKAIVLSTHILEEVEAVCTRVVIIARGRIVADCTPDELLARSHRHNAVVMTLSTCDAALQGAIAGELERAPGVERVEQSASETGRVSFTMYPRDGQPIIAPISELIRSRQWPVDELRVERGRLDEVFRRITLGADSKEPDEAQSVDRREPEPAEAAS